MGMGMGLLGLLDWVTGLVGGKYEVGLGRLRWRFDLVFPIGDVGKVWNLGFAGGCRNRVCIWVVGIQLRSKLGFG